MPCPKAYAWVFISSDKEGSLNCKVLVCREKINDTEEMENYMNMDINLLNDVTFADWWCMDAVLCCK